jgi:hypothetical protein
MKYFVSGDAFKDESRCDFLSLGLGKEGEWDVLVFFNADFDFDYWEKKGVDWLEDDNIKALLFALLYKERDVRVLQSFNIKEGESSFAVLKRLIQEFGDSKEMIAKQVNKYITEDEINLFGIKGEFIESCVSGMLHSYHVIRYEDLEELNKRFRRFNSEDMIFDNYVEKRVLNLLKINHKNTPHFLL